MCAGAFARAAGRLDGALLTEDGELRLEKGGAIELRYGVYMRKGAPAIKDLDLIWDGFAGEG